VEDSNSLSETNDVGFDFKDVASDQATATPSPTAASSAQTTMDPGKCYVNQIGPDNVCYQEGDPGRCYVNQIGPDNVCYQEGVDIFVLFDNCDPLKDD
jgi:hypothetical protein